MIACLLSPWCRRRPAGDDDEACVPSPPSDVAAVGLDSAGGVLRRVSR